VVLGFEIDDGLVLDGLGTVVVRMLVKTVVGFSRVVEGGLIVVAEVILPEEVLAEVGRF
jgi:hypothetical protein